MGSYLQCFANQERILKIAEETCSEQEMHSENIELQREHFNLVKVPAKESSIWLQEILFGRFLSGEDFSYCKRCSFIGSSLANGALNFTLPGSCWIDFLRKSRNGLVNGDICVSLVTLKVLPTGIVAFQRNVGGTDKYIGKSIVERTKPFEDSTQLIFLIGQFINLTTITNEVFRERKFF
jgi:hypothetical protein